MVFTRHGLSAFLFVGEFLGQYGDGFHCDYGDWLGVKIRILNENIASRTRHCERRLENEAKRDYPTGAKQSVDACQERLSQILLFPNDYFGRHQRIASSVAPFLRFLLAMTG